MIRAESLACPEGFESPTSDPKNGASQNSTKSGINPRLKSWVRPVSFPSHSMTPRLSLESFWRQTNKNNRAERADTLSTPKRTTDSQDL